MEDQWRTANAGVLAAIAMERKLVVDVDQATIPGLAVVAAPHFTHTLPEQELRAFLLGMLAAHTASASQPLREEQHPAPAPAAPGLRWRHREYLITLDLTKDMDREDRTAEFTVYDAAGATFGSVRFHYLNFRDDPDLDRACVDTALASLKRRLDNKQSFTWPFEEVDLSRRLDD